MGKKETSTEMSTIKPSDAKTYVEHCMKVNRPVFLWGSPGIGKSDIIQQIADEQGRKVIDMRLILMGPEDLKGIPYFNSNDGSMHWAPSSELPEVVTQEQVDVAKDTRDRHLNLLNLAKATDCLEDVSEEASRVKFIDETELKFKISDEKYGRLKGSLEFQDAILFLDEMNSAPQSVQGAAYQLTLDRKIGEYELPKGVSIICAGNHDSDKGHSHRMPTPLANRLIHLSLDVDFNDWQDWAITNGIHPDIVGYLTVSPMKLHNFDPSSKNKSFATPRSWEFVSDLLAEDMPQSMAKDLIAGTVGEGLAIEFIQHRNISAKMPDPYLILEGEEKKLDVTDVSARYSLCVSLCYILKDMAGKIDDISHPEVTQSYFNKCYDNFFFYIMDVMSEELVILGVCTALKTMKIPIDRENSKAFDALFEDYKQYVLGDIA